MVKLELDVDPVNLFMKPEHALQQFSLVVAKARESMLSSMKGIEWNNSTSKGTVHDCNTAHIVIRQPDNTLTQIPLTGARLRQLVTATTTRK